MRTLLLLSLCTVVFLSSFNPEKKPKLKLPKEFAKIPAGTVTLPRKNAEGNFMYGSQSTFSMQSFYMSKYEVSNADYRKFVTEVEPGLSSNDVLIILPDTSAWSRLIGKSEPLERFYFRHQSFNNYPVVNVSYSGALKYCEWVERKLQADNPDFEIDVKLPSLIDWVYAARGGRSQAMFPWGNYYLRNSKGVALCNFNEVPDSHIYRDRITGQPAVATSPPDAKRKYTSTIDSFYPNDYGLYNMCGNAAEMLYEAGICMGGSWNDYGGDVQILAMQTFQGGSPTVGFRPMIVVKERP